jgi:hypothetical protein
MEENKSVGALENFTALHIDYKPIVVRILCSMCGGYNGVKDMLGTAPEGATGLPTWSAFHFACGENHLDICEECWPRVVDYLLEGAKTWLKRSKTNTP